MAINIKRVTALRDLLLNTHEEDINMETWFKPEGLDASEAPTNAISAKKEGWSCGTTACIAGHCVVNLMTDEDIKNIPYNQTIANVAAEYLGLNFKEKWTLFYAEYSDDEGGIQQMDLDTITKDEIIKALNIVIEQKKVPDDLFYLIREGKL